MIVIENRTAEPYFTDIDIFIDYGGAKVSRKSRESEKGNARIFPQISIFS